MDDNRIRMAMEIWLEESLAHHKTKVELARTRAALAEAMEAMLPIEVNGGVAVPDWKSMRAASKQGREVLGMVKSTTPNTKR